MNSYNEFIKSKGKKFYVFLLIVTTILQSLALSVLPCYIDNSWDNVYFLFFISLVIFSIINAIRYTQFDKL